MIAARTSAVASMVCAGCSRGSLGRRGRSGPHDAPPESVGARMTSVARTLYDIAQGFDWPLEPEPRVRRALRLLRRIVPYDRCGLLDAAAVGAPNLVVEPDAAAERDGVSRILTRFLTL